MTQQPQKQNSILLEGLDGSNPLAFLAALGTLRVLDSAFPQMSPTLQWVSAGRWLPSIAVCGDGARMANDTEFCGLVTEALAASRVVETLNIGNKLDLAAGDFRKCCESTAAAATLDKRDSADCLAALGCDLTNRWGKMSKTLFDFTSGNQQLLAMMRGVAEKRHDLSQTLFNWTYRTADSLRWDPLDEARQYAYQFHDPTNAAMNPIKSNSGANRLAMEGLAFFPVMPGQPTANTTGMNRRNREYTFTWPIWSVPAGVRVVKSILSMSDLGGDRPNRKDMQQIGIAEIFRSRIVMPTGRYRSFTPACSVGR